MSNDSNFLCPSLRQDLWTQNTFVEIIDTTVNLDFILHRASDYEFQSPLSPVFLSSCPFPVLFSSFLLSEPVKGQKLSIVFRAKYILCH